MLGTTNIIFFSLNIFLILNTKLFCNKWLSINIKTEAFLENREHIILEANILFKILRQTSQFQTHLIWFRTIGAPKSLEGITKLDTIREQFAWQIFNSFFMKNVQWQYLESELWGNNKFCWVAGNIMSLMKRFKNTSEGLVMTCSSDLSPYVAFMCQTQALREKCLNTEFSLVRIFLFLN